MRTIPDVRTTDNRQRIASWTRGLMHANEVQPPLLGWGPAPTIRQARTGRPHRGHTDRFARELHPAHKCVGRTALHPRVRPRPDVLEVALANDDHVTYRREARSRTRPYSLRARISVNVIAAAAHSNPRRRNHRLLTRHSHRREDRSGPTSCRGRLDRSHRRESRPARGRAARACGAGSRCAS